VVHQPTPLSALIVHALRSLAQAQPTTIDYQIYPPKVWQLNSGCPLKSHATVSECRRGLRFVLHLHELFDAYSSWRHTRQLSKHGLFVKGFCKFHKWRVWPTDRATTLLHSKNDYTGLCARACIGTGWLPWLVADWRARLPHMHPSCQMSWMFE
jgi:hypothetical protein